MKVLKNWKKISFKYYRSFSIKNFPSRVNFSNFSNDGYFFFNYIEYISYHKLERFIYRVTEFPKLSQNKEFIKLMNSDLSLNNNDDIMNVLEKIKNNDKFTDFIILLKGIFLMTYYLVN